MSNERETKDRFVMKITITQNKNDIHIKNH